MRGDIFYEVFNTLYHVQGYHFVICVDSESVICALKNWNCKMRGDIFYEVFNTLYHVQGYWD